MGCTTTLSVVLQMIILVGLRSGFSATENSWSWQKPHAEIVAEGDLKWQPESFRYEPGSSVYYIDYENGNDNNSGASKTQPWKHHPWDPEATGNARTHSGIHTYVFKKGVIYRGKLIADESGADGNPIRLTVDPDWGEGEALFYGSEKVTGWEKRSLSSMPNGDKIWYKMVPFTPRSIWMMDGDSIVRLALARSPNWKVSNPDDVKSEWWMWERTGKKVVNGKTLSLGLDPKHITESPHYYLGGLVYSEWGIVMSTPYAAEIEYADSNGLLGFRGFFGSDGGDAATKGRYYIEDKPQYLDTTGEFWVRKSSGSTQDYGQVYLRLPEDKDPNEAHIEAANHLNLIELGNSGNISISGITFRFSNVFWNLSARWFADKDVECAVIRKLGHGRNITIRNCRFEHVNRAIRIEINGGYVDSLQICDNDIRYTDHGAIQVGNNLSGHISVLRNNLYQIGLRPWRSSHGHALDVRFPETAEIAGNMLYRCYGAGLFIFGGKKSGAGSEVPLSRILIHHNKVVDPLLNTNDWGGIETWQGGPFYVYNNISGNPGGYRHWAHYPTRNFPASMRSFGTARQGFAYYLDAAFKNYHFNNIAWGKSNDLTSPLCNTTALQEIHGFQNTFFNNTFFKFGAGSRRQNPSAQRNLYLGNLWLDISDWIFYQSKPDGDPPDPNANDVGTVDTLYDYQTQGYGHNVFHKLPRKFGVFEGKGTPHAEFSTFKDALEQHKMLCMDLGKVAERSPVADAEQHDFRVPVGSPAVDEGVRVFVPWGLYKMIGEWNFHRNDTDPKHLTDDHWFMADYYGERTTYENMPKYPLTAVNVSANDYVEGNLEDWTKSALRFNGTNQYAYARHSDMVTQLPSSKNIVTPDVETDNFLIEVYLKTVDGHAGGLVVGKANTSGYILDIDPAGKVRLRLRAGGSDVATRTSTKAINDGQWRHILAEVDRGKSEGIRIYVDGKDDSYVFEGAMPSNSIGNNADLLVGGGPDWTYFAGTIDFLRIARGTLADAKTSIEELYAWQFDGPQGSDFVGKSIRGEFRDAGAFEEDPDVGVQDKNAHNAATATSTVKTLLKAAETGVRSGAK